MCFEDIYDTAAAAIPSLIGKNDDANDENEVRALIAFYDVENHVYR